MPDLPMSPDAKLWQDIQQKYAQLLPKEECGVFGVFQYPERKTKVLATVANMAILGLHALQHRGQEGAGIVTYQGNTAMGMEEEPLSIKGKGMVSQVFEDKQAMKELVGSIALGHVRYPTRGKKSDSNALQPFTRLSTLGRFSLAHNGQFTNSRQIRHNLAKINRAFDSRSDTMALVEAIASSTLPTLIDRIKYGVMEMRGAYALVLATPKQLIGFRDPNGIRPLVLGELENQEGYVLASESCALDIIGARLIRDVAPGEMIVIDENGVHAEFFAGGGRKPRTCIFEYVYFSRPDSVVDRRHVYACRKQMGEQLAVEERARMKQQNITDMLGDLVISVPDSGNPAAMGFANGLGLEYDMGIIRNHYTGRSFIEPDQLSRITKVKIKHNPNTSVLAGRRVYVVDDSVVRGHTSVNIVQMLRRAGASEVHLRVSCPQVLYSCFYGVDIADREDLLSVKYQGDLEKILDFIGADSIAFLSLEGIYKALGETERNPDAPQFTDHYFTGDYPVVPDQHEELDFHYVDQPRLPLE